ncbi:MAG TPA: hypothetical protein VFC10_17405 [Terriglobia bacterium]|jgi:hypothetical protein|nr:hypothetical protein [Terriglobia bacterium]
MGQMTFATVPGFVDLPDSVLQADQPLTDYDLTKINNNAKFAAVRPEVFYGWYKNGETVIIPTSPVDGYVYARQELEYEVAAWCSRSPAGGAATNGALVKPARANTNDAPGTLFLMDFWVEEKNEASPGLVHCEVHYWDNGTEYPTNGGFVKVRTIATRLSN